VKKVTRVSYCYEANRNQHIKTAQNNSCTVTDIDCWFVKTNSKTIDSYSSRWFTM